MSCFKNQINVLKTTTPEVEVSHVVKYLFLFVLFTFPFSAQASIGGFKDMVRQLGDEDKIQRMAQEPAIINLSKEVNLTPQETARELLRIGRAADAYLIKLARAMESNDEHRAAVEIASAMDEVKGKLLDIKANFPEPHLKLIFNQVVSERVGEPVDMYSMVMSSN